MHPGYDTEFSFGSILAKFHLLHAFGVVFLFAGVAHLSAVGFALFFAVGFALFVLLPSCRRRRAELLLLRVAVTSPRHALRMGAPLRAVRSALLSTLPRTEWVKSLGSICLCVRGFGAVSGPLERGARNTLLELLPRRSVPWSTLRPGNSADQAIAYPRCCLQSGCAYSTLDCLVVMPFSCRNWTLSYACLSCNLYRWWAMVLSTSGFCCLIHGTASQRFHRKRYMLRVLFLDVAVRQSSHVIFLSSSKGRSLLLITLIATADLVNRGDTLHETNVLATECDQNQFHACTALETRLQFIQQPRHCRHHPNPVQRLAIVS